MERKILVLVVSLFLSNPILAFADATVSFEELPSQIVTLERSQSKKKTKSSTLKQWHLDDLSTQKAWKISSGHGVNIADCGNGVDASHPDLAQNINYDLAYNLLEDKKDGWQVIQNYHSTQVAGVMIGSRNSFGITGVAPNAKVVPIKVGANETAKTSLIAKCIRYAADIGIRIINASYVDLENQIDIIQATNYAESKGSIFVFSAGNSGLTVSANNTESMLGIAAIDQKSNRARFSTTGNHVDFAAPGIDIITTSSNRGYTKVKGTSYSSPIVAATIANILSVKPNLTNTQVKEILKNSATDLGTKGYDQQFGFGKINLLKALNLTRTKY
jgi:thermitase